MAAAAVLSSLTWSSPRTVEASKPRCRLEKVDLESLERTGQLQVIGGSTELEGQPSSGKQARDYRLLLNGKTVARAEKVEAFEKTSQDLYIALLIEHSALYAPAIDKIKEALREFLSTLPPRAKIKLIQFGYDIEPQPSFMPAGALDQVIDEMNPDDQGEVQLINAVNAGLQALNKVPPQKGKDGKPLGPPRKVIIVISDGLNALMDRKSFKRTGDLLRQNGVPLFPIAFSPRDDRGPLLNLGEMAKRSAGTFRWAQSDAAIKDQLLSLRDELFRGTVITFPGKKLDAEDLRTGAVVLQCGELKSIPYHATATPPKPSRWWRWPLYIIGLLVGLWLLAQGALFVLRRRAPGLLQPQPGTTTPPPPGVPPPATGGYPLPTGGYPAPPPGTFGTGGYPQAPPGQSLPISGRRLEVTLIAIGGEHGGKRIAVGDILVIGQAISGEGALQILDDPGVAPRHCELRRDPMGLLMNDLGSPGGTFVNDQRLSGPCRMSGGEIIRIGEHTQFKLRIDD